MIDIDGDDHPEVWVRGDEGQYYQGVYSVVNDSVTLLASSDVRSELIFYKGAVGFGGYYGDGLSRKGFTTLRNSRPVDWYFNEDKYSAETEETIYSNMTKNGEDISEAEWEKAEQLLGDPISVTPAWRPIE